MAAAMRASSAAQNQHQTAVTGARAAFEQLQVFDAHFVSVRIDEHADAAVVLGDLNLEMTFHSDERRGKIKDSFSPLISIRGH